MARGQSDYKYLEVCWEIIKLVDRDGDAFNVGVFLPFETQDSLKEHVSLLRVSTHSYEALHEVLENKYESVDYPRAELTDESAPGLHPTHRHLPQAYLNDAGSAQ